MSNGTTTIRDEPAGERRLDRRVVLGGTAAAAAGLVTRLTATNPAAAQEATPAAARGERATIVLVHGAYAGGWIWRKVIPLLREAGHDVYATTATGMGDRVHLADPAINLDTYITDVVNVLTFEDLHEVTLVGWSFGGTIITGVAEQVPERLARLVYFDANMPTHGQSNYDFLGRNDEFVGSQYRYGQEIGMPGFEPVPTEAIQSLTKDPADAAWLLERLVPQPMATESQPLTLGNPAAAALPRAFIFCTEEKGPPEEDPLARVAAQVRSDPHWTYRELAQNHLAPVNDPQATAEAFLSLL
jgi:pimeloyl-ACP methyl ester carboxylesterase